MKNLSQEFKQRLAAEVTTLCRCWILKRVDGTTLGFTDHDEELIVEGTSCEAISGVEAGSVESSLGMNVDSQDISGALSSLAITEADIDANLYDQARLEVFIVDWMEPSFHFKENEYLIGEITREDGVFKAELRGIASVLDQSQGRLCSRHCPVDLGSGLCGVNLDDPQHNAICTVHQVKSAMIITVDGLSSFPQGWFTGGKLKIIDGQNSDVSVEIAKHTNFDDEVSLTLWQPFSQKLSVGQQLSVRVGCDKSFETCKQKFSNQLNFQGFPHLPGNDFAMNYAANSDRMDGGPLVP